MPVSPAPIQRVIFFFKLPEQAQRFLKTRSYRLHFCEVQKYITAITRHLTLLLLNTICPVLANSVDPDQLASEEANWSGSALFVIKYVNFYQKPGSSNLTGWKLEMGVAS